MMITIITITTASRDGDRSKHRAYHHTRTQKDNKRTATPWIEYPVLLVDRWWCEGGHTGIIAQSESYRYQNKIIRRSLFVCPLVLFPRWCFDRHELDEILRFRRRWHSGPKLYNRSLQDIVGRRPAIHELLPRISKTDRDLVSSFYLINALRHCHEYDYRHAVILAIHKPRQSERLPVTNQQ